MRIADRIRYEIFKNNLGSLKEKIDTNQARVASGRKILKPSDDPLITGKSIQIDAEKYMNEQYKRNLDKLKMNGAYYETSINTINDLLTRAKQLSVAQASDNVDAASRKTAADEVGRIIDQLVTVGNTKIAGSYIFGGKKSNQPPFAFNPALNDDTVDWSGTDEVTMVAVSSGATLESGISGKTIFGEGSVAGRARIFEVLKQFRADLNGNDRAAIRSDIDKIDTCVNLTSNNLSYVGTYTRSIDSMIDTNELKNTTLTATQSSLVDADMLSLIADFNTLSTAYQAALNSMSRIQDLNILNYMR